MLTSAQQTVLRNYVQTDPVLGAILPGPDNAFTIASALNTLAAPDFIVWRSLVTEHEITRNTSSEGTTWSWTAFIARSEAERSGWARMFNGTYTINPSLPNVRQGFQDVFSGASNNAPAQRTHLAAICKRKATVCEKLLAAGTGSLASPATMDYEGAVSYQDVITFMGW